MTSILKVDSIQNAAGTTAATIDSSGRLLTPARPVFRAYNASALYTQNYSDWTKFTNWAEQYDVGGNFGSNKFTAPVSGYYQINATCRIDDDGGTWFGIRAYINGSGDFPSTSIAAPIAFFNEGASQLNTAQIHDLLYLSANDYVEIYLRSGSDTSVTVPDQQTYWSMYLVG